METLIEGKHDEIQDPDTSWIGVKLVLDIFRN